MSTQTTMERAKPNGRIEEERQQRRRRSDHGTGRLDPLIIVGDRDPNYVYRWVNDTPGRIHQLTQMDDWDLVTDVAKTEKDKSLGVSLERVVDRRTGQRAVLVRKPKSYYVEDKAKEQASIAQTESHVRAGRINKPEALEGPVSYGGATIQHAGKSSSYTP